MENSVDMYCIYIYIDIKWMFSKAIIPHPYIYIYIIYIIYILYIYIYMHIIWWFTPPMYGQKLNHVAPEWRPTRQGPKHWKPPRSTSAITGEKKLIRLISCLKWSKNGPCHCEKCTSGFLFKIGGVRGSNKCWFGQRVNDHDLRQTKPVSGDLKGHAKN